MNNTLCVIPARFASTRLPGKPLLLLKDLPIVMWVYRAAEKSGVFDKVVVATDDLRIKDTVEKHGGEAIITSKHHKTGSDRVWEIASNLEYDIIVNLQGDEPFIKPTILRELVKTLINEKRADIATPIRKPLDLWEIQSSSTAKVIVDREGFALYFSRAPIPYPKTGEFNINHYNIHIGIYAYRKEALEAFVKATLPAIEEIESLEQLRALYNGLRIKIVPVEYSGVSIDTPEDYERAKKIVGGDYD